MISIRATLLCWLLPGFAAICLIAGISIHFSTQADLTAKLDAQLNELANDIRLRPQSRENDRRRPNKPTTYTDLIEEMKRRKLNWNQVLDQLPPTAYCEILFNPPDKRIQSKNLYNTKIPHPNNLTEQAIFYNLRLDNGVAVRVRAEKMSISRNGRSPKILLALNREKVDATLQQLTTKILTGGIICCAIFGIILSLALKLALRPLRKLGEQASTMNAESLHKRFPENAIPADIRPIVERLNGLMAHLEESFARERRFSGDIAHELRTPLAAIRTTSEVAIKWPDQTTTEDFSEIARLSTQLQQTLDSLLLLARMESSTAEAIQEPVRLQPLIEECAALYQKAAEARTITFNLQLTHAPEIESDPRLLRIIISNLINNAVEYAPAGNQITLTSNRENVFECTNNAPDLSPDEVSHLFERLWRKDKVRTESGHTGLGLSIAQSCATVLHHSLTAKLDDKNQLHISLKKPAAPHNTTG